MLEKKVEFLNCNNLLTYLHDVSLMGILNVTPDSFFDGGKFRESNKIRERVASMVSEGADIIDIGGYSSRPGAEHISEEEEWRRLEGPLKMIRREYPEIKISIDTFRSKVAKKALNKYNVEIINDISGGNMDAQMADVVASHNAVYVLMHMQGTPQNMQQNPSYHNLMADILVDLQKRIDVLQQKGVKDIIVDPGFGFGKTLEHNYALLSQLKIFNLLNKPVLVGLSRKSMLYNLLQTNPAEALNATTAAHMACLMHGANILRVHDVKEARECIDIYRKMAAVQ